MRAGLRIKENKEVYEGEVTELTPEEAESQTGGYGKVIASVVIGLKTVKARRAAQQGVYGLLVQAEASKCGKLIVSI